MEFKNVTAVAKTNVYFDGKVVGLDRFGLSAPAPQVYQELGVTTAAVVAAGPAGSAYATPATNQSLYDLLGRTYRVGIRFKL